MRKEITSRNGKHNGKIFKLSQCISSQMEKKNSIQTIEDWSEEILH